MDRRARNIVLAWSICFVIVVFVFHATSLGSLTKIVPRMSKEQLNQRIDDPNLVIIDVRDVDDWMASDAKIKGAVREDPAGAAEWAKKYDKKKTYVLYCASPEEYTSVVAGGYMMALVGFIEVYVLKGGWQQWQAARYPVEPKEER